MHRHLAAARRAAALALVTTAALSAAPHPSILQSGFVYDSAPYPECHASTIAETSRGTIVAAWFGGAEERAPDVCIYVARREGGRWLHPAMAADGVQADGKRFPTWNPVLFQAPRGGPLLLFYKVGPNPREWWGMVTASTDDGRTWARPERLPEGILGPIKNKPVVLADGTWLSPSSTEGGEKGWVIHFERSRDAGRTWETIGPVDKGQAGFGAIQPAVLFHRDGRLEALSRTQQRVVAVTWSSDGGKTWRPLAPTELPNPNSGIDAVTLADGRQLIVYNHSGSRDRWPLDVAISTDGLAWSRVLTLETEPLPSGYAYPAVIQTTDGLVHITYTWDRKRIKHVVLDPAKLK
jgi:predicted neuraminidase